MVAKVLEENDYTLRSGGASGADTAFESGVITKKEIFIPWNGFNKRSNKEHGVYSEWPDVHTAQQAYNLAQEYHPNWIACTAGARALHARNMAQILGRDLNQPAKFVVCWTKNGKGGGGTGQALRVAKALDIPIFDLGSDMNDKLVTLAMYSGSICGESNA